MEEQKYYFFRDLDHKLNHEDNRSYHAAGIIEGINEPSFGGKDYVVLYLEPFKGTTLREYRAVDEVEIFEVRQDEYEYAVENYNNIEKLTGR